MLCSKNLLAQAVALGLAFVCVPAAANTCRVTTAGVEGNDGSDWSAPKSLQGALNTVACSEIWVAKGVYKPAPNTAFVSFNVQPHVAVYGGFAGTETSLAERTDIAGNPTVLSGDIDGNDSVDANGVDRTVDNAHNSDNSLRVVVMDGTTVAGNIDADTVLDGLIITAASNPGGNGGGIYCNANGDGYRCSPTLRTVTFSGNSANNGGAMYNFGGNGGASSPTLTMVTFSGNAAGHEGGALFTLGTFGGVSNPVLGNVTFSGNSAINNGGAMASYGYNGTSSPELSNVTFSGNTATDATSCGGALYNFFSFPMLSNVILWGDTSANNPGANEICNANSGPPSTGSPYFINSVVQGSGGSNAWSFNLGTDLGGNLDADPKLGPLQDDGGTTETMLPGAGSSAIDHGDAATCSAAPVSGEDQRGVARPQGGECDIGAVESRIPDRIFAGTFESTLPAD